MGGAIFVESGGSVTLAGTTSMSGGSVTPGQGGTGALGLGSGIYLHGTAGLVISAADGETVTISNDIASDAYNAPSDPNNPDPAGDGQDTGITKQGAGTLVLSGNNSFVGGVTIAGGILSVSSDGALGHASGQVVIQEGATLEATADFTSGRSVVISGDGAIAVVSGATLTFLGDLSGTGDLLKTGDGILTIAGTNTLDGSVVIGGGKVIDETGAFFDNPDAVIGVTNNATLEFTTSANVSSAISFVGDGHIGVSPDSVVVNATGKISGDGNFTKTGPGTLVLANSENDYTGATLLEEGTLRLGADDATGSGPMHISAGSIFDLDGYTTTIGPLSGEAGASILLGDGTLTVNQDTDTTYAGEIAGPGSFAKDGSGNLTLSSDLSGLSDLAIDAGAIALGADQMAPDLNVRVATNGLFDLNDFDATIATISSAAGSTVDLGSGTLTIAGSNDSSIAGNIEGTGQLVKSGTGTLTFSGSTTSTTGVLIDQGGARVDGTLLTTELTVGQNGDLYGTGTIGNQIIVHGRLAPGSLSPDEIIDNHQHPATAERLRVTGDVIFEPTSTFIGDMAADGTANRLEVDGTVTINGGKFLIMDQDDQFNPKGEYIMISATGGVTGTFDEYEDNLVFLEPWLTYTHNSVRLTFAVQFDPSQYSGNAGAVGNAIAGLIDDGTATGTLARLIDELTLLDEDAAPHVLWSMGTEIYSDASASVRRMLTGTDRMVSRRLNRQAAPGLEFWTDYQFRTAHFSYDGNASRGTSNEHGQLFGADFATAGGQLILGAFGGMLWSDISLGQIDQRASIFGPQFGLYGQWSGAGSRIYGRSTVAAPQVKGHRHYGAGNVDLVAHGRYTMFAADARLGYGLDIPSGPLLISPFLEAGIQQLNRPSAREKGADNAGLALSRANLTSGDVRLGAMVKLAPMALDPVWELRPVIGATYSYIFGDTLDKVESAFIGGLNRPFRTSGVDTGHNAGGLSAAIDISRVDNWASIRLAYGFDFARNLSSHSVGLSGRISW